jgi:hypothetical protein
MDPRIDILWAHHEIIGVLNDYADLIDTGRCAEVAAAVFTPDAIEDHGFGSAIHHGRAQITQFLSDALRPFEAAQHSLSNFMVKIDGDKASSRTYLQAYHWLKTDGPTDRPADYVAVGVYIDEWQRTAEGWRISYRRRRGLGSSPVGVGVRPRHLLAPKPGGPGHR